MLGVSEFTFMSNLQVGSLRLQVHIGFQINNFDANGYHPFKGCYPCELNRHVMEI